MGKLQDIASYSDLLANLRTYINSMKATIAQQGKEIDASKAQELRFVDHLSQQKERIAEIDQRKEVEQLRIEAATLQAEVSRLREQVRAQDQTDRIAALEQFAAAQRAELETLRDRLNSLDLRQSLAQSPTLVVPHRPRKPTTRAIAHKPERDA